MRPPNVPFIRLNFVWGILAGKRKWSDFQIIYFIGIYFQRIETLNFGVKAQKFRKSEIDIFVKRSVLHRP